MSLPDILAQHDTYSSRRRESSGSHRLGSIVCALGIQCSCNSRGRSRSPNGAHTRRFPCRDSCHICLEHSNDLLNIAPSPNTCRRKSEYAHTSRQMNSRLDHGLDNHPLSYKTGRLIQHICYSCSSRFHTRCSCYSGRCSSTSCSHISREYTGNSHTLHRLDSFHYR